MKISMSIVIAIDNNRLFQYPFFLYKKTLQNTETIAFWAIEIYHAVGRKIIAIELIGLTWIIKFRLKFESFKQSSSKMSSLFFQFNRESIASPIKFQCIQVKKNSFHSLCASVKYISVVIVVQYKRRKKKWKRIPNGKC